jgi:hypothetical protein
MKPILLVLLLLPRCAAAEAPSWETVLTYAEKDGEKTWNAVLQRSPTLGSRDIFRYALVLCESGNHPNRLKTLFEVAAQMQDRDPGSTGYGNFHWRWSEDAVRDQNAVEFCMQSASLIWLRHQDTLPNDAKNILHETLALAVEGCMRHGIRESYTNIALMNAGNLILLGEAMGISAAVDEGYRRLELAAQFIYRFGTHEYVSPTYYGVDLEVLSMTARFARHVPGRNLASALLELIWTDVAVNFFPPAGRLAGSHSRSYDYLRGLGHFDVNLWVEGWIGGSPRGGTNAIYQALAGYHPPESMRALSHQFPRLIRQSWDITPDAARTHFVLPDVSLSTSGASYGTQDITLAIDFPGPRNSVRGYFIPDARHDPYGKNTIAAGNHQKALHLSPLWRAAQRKQDALALVSYRPDDIPDVYLSLESHIVLPLETDGYWVDGRAISPTTTPSVAVPMGAAIVLRKGTAVVGIRVLYATKQDGTQADISLVNDQNPYHAIRLSVDHLSDSKNQNPTAAFWVRVGTGIDTEDALQSWQRQFSAARPDIELSDANIDITVPGVEGPVQIDLSGDTVVPSHTRAVLEVDGVDVGRQIMDRVSGLSERAKNTPTDTVVVGSAGVYWEAESGQIVPPMMPGQDLNASQGYYVWMAGPEGGRGGSDLASMTWSIRAAQSGTFFIWARVLTPTPDDDSFYLSASGETGFLLPRSEWHAGQYKSWTWIPIRINRSEQITPFTFEAGVVQVVLRARENGAKIDRLFVTPNAQDKP